MTCTVVMKEGAAPPSGSAQEAMLQFLEHLRVRSQLLRLFLQSDHKGVRDACPTSAPVFSASDSMIASAPSHGAYGGP